MNRIPVLLPALLAAAAMGAEAPYTDLVPRYDRQTSNVMARKLSRPTPANLDYAAYTANPILSQREKPKYKPPASPVAVMDITFGGKLTGVKDRLGETPLTPEERSQPFAWRPLVKRLWNVVKERSFPALGGEINGFKWADSSVYQPYQEISAAYLHGEGDSLRLWLKIEFSPWVTFLRAVDDEDADGIREVYGMLSPGVIPADSLKKAVRWIRDEYSRKILSNEEITDWVTDLASYWYPTKNTDIVTLGESSAWPDRGTEKSVVATMAGSVIKNPVAVVKGKPFEPSKPIYNVYVVESADTAARPERKAAHEAPAAAAGVADTARSANFQENQARFAMERERYGKHETWAEKNAPFRKGLAAYMAKLPAGQMAFAGKEGWLFFRKSVEYAVCGDLAKQAAVTNPLPPIAAFNDYLKDRGVNMLFVPVPCKEEVYFEKLPADVPAPAVPLVNPYGRKFLSELQAAGVEVVDLLPLFLEAKERDTARPLYQRHDTHWTTRGLLVAAAAIAKRIEEYRWYGGMTKTNYTVTDTTVSRLGDLVDKLPESARAKYSPATLEAKQVRAEGGKRYAGGKESPIMLIGDSFTGQFEHIDCKSAGVGSHLAATTGLGVEIITSWGGGPLVRKKAMRAREQSLGSKKLVIYMMADRDLYNYRMGWEPFPGK